MSTITKLTNKGHPGRQRYVSWDSAYDLNDDGGPFSSGDIFRIDRSLYRPAANLSITTAGGSASFRLNPVFKIYPRRPDYEMGSYMSQTLNYVASGVEHWDSGVMTIVIEAGETFTLQQEMDIDNIEIVTLSGTMRLSAD